MEFDGFEKLFSRFLLEDANQSSIDWQEIRPPPEGTVSLKFLRKFDRFVLKLFKVIPYKKLTTADLSDKKELLDKLIVVKLNGGLGTTMGCQGPKSVISVRNDLTFLDLTIQQLDVRSYFSDFHDKLNSFCIFQALNSQCGCNVPLVLMNSFNTHEETEKVVDKYSHVSVKIYSFNQSK